MSKALKVAGYVVAGYLTLNAVAFVALVVNDKIKNGKKS